MADPSDDYHALSPIEGAVEKAFGSPSAWSRGKRFALGGVVFIAYLAMAQYESGFPALFLAIALFGVLQHWAIEEPKQGGIADAYIWAGLTGMVALGAFAIWWWFLGPPELQTWSTHVWLPLGIVSLALALDRYRRPLTPVESIGQALSEARTRPRTPKAPPPA